MQVFFSFFFYLQHIYRVGVYDISNQKTINILFVTHLQIRRSNCSCIFYKKRKKKHLENHLVDTLTTNGHLENKDTIGSNLMAFTYFREDNNHDITMIYVLTTRVFGIIFIKYTTQDQKL